MEFRNTLHLTLKKKWFQLMLSGQKQVEIRKRSEWIQQRLINKDYDIIRFVNGYGKEKPFFTCKFKGYVIAKKDEELTFGNEIVNVKKGDYKIFFGDVIEKGNV